MIKKKSNNFPNIKTISRANVKVSDNKPYNLYKNLLDVSNLNEQMSEVISVDPTPKTNVSKVTAKKMFKRPYKKFEDLEVVKASKHATKRKNEGLYDTAATYGAASKPVTTTGDNYTNKKKLKDYKLNKSYDSINRISEKPYEDNEDEEEEGTRGYSNIRNIREEDDENLDDGDYERRYGRSKNKKGFDFENNKNFQVLFDLKKKKSSKQSGLENQNERDGNKDQPIYYSYNNLQAINNNINQNNGNNANENKPFNDLRKAK